MMLPIKSALETMHEKYIDNLLQQCSLVAG